MRCPLSTQCGWDVSCDSLGDWQSHMVDVHHARYLKTNQKGEYEMRVIIPIRKSIRSLRNCCLIEVPDVGMFLWVMRGDLTESGDYKFSVTVRCCMEGSSSEFDFHLRLISPNQPHGISILGECERLNFHSKPANKKRVAALSFSYLQDHLLFQPVEPQTFLLRASSTSGSRSSQASEHGYDHGNSNNNNNTHGYNNNISRGSSTGSLYSDENTDNFNFSRSDLDSVRMLDFIGEIQISQWRTQLKRLNVGGGGGSLTPRTSRTPPASPSFTKWRSTGALLQVDVKQTPQPMRTGSFQEMRVKSPEEAFSCGGSDSLTEDS